ncbi:MAG: serine/threonine-protein kinase, partial [Planctomycetota bacterium]
MTRRIDVGDRVGEYVLETKLGAGSFGEVYKARHRALDGVHVAVKLPRDARALARLLDEGALTRRVESDAAVKLIGLDVEHDPPYLAMQYVDGESLRETLRRGALPARRALDVAKRVFGALAAAHEASVIHRDVKPENILIDSAGNAFLGDFGLAAALDADGSTDLGSLGSNRTQSLVGTVRYLSPEQKDPRRAIDGRSDIYAA